MFNTAEFITEYITQRTESLFLPDLEAHREELKAAIKGKSALVIGGAGTIGSSFIKALLGYEPDRLYVIDISENGLTELTRDLRSTHGLVIPDDYKPYPIDFATPVFEQILKREGPFDVVANFAAHKHVRSEKDAYSISALINNNVLNAARLLDRLSETPPQHFFCVSTDKAANPVNVMGASKKIMEEVIMAYASEFSVTTARFANVAFSNGSLLDGFISRMMKQQPLSAPSDVKRHFVSPEESGQICLVASVLGSAGDVFFPKLQERQMMTFSRIAGDFLRFQGLEPQVCASEEEAKRRAAERIASSQTYPVYYFKSDTSGEKAFEEFVAEGEEVDGELFQSLGVIKNAPRMPIAQIRELTMALSECITRDGIRKSDIIEVLHGFLPSFNHVETGKCLDQKM